MSMKKSLIKGAQVVNEGKIETKDILIENGRFEKIENSISVKEKTIEIDAANHYLLPGLIDDQVHFREPD
jgi:dihydroorotase